MTAENSTQKSLRRSVSGKVTELLNTVATQGYRLTQDNGVPSPAEEIGSMIRRCVLLALRNIDDKIRMLESDAQKELNLSSTRGSLIKFYMKGGNAYKCVIGGVLDIQAAKNDNGGGTSDWDTQVVVNPWIPSPIRARLYNDTIEVTLSEFRQCAEDVAHIVHNNHLDIVLNLNSVPIGDAVTQNEKKDGVAAGRYVFVLDEQQTTRRIFNYDNLGMVYDDRVNLTPATGMDKKDGPGILLHDAIKPFMLYRLGYTGKIFKLKDNLPGPITAGITEEEYDTNEEQPRKALGELIDITIPRLDTIEAVEVWESLASNQIQITHTDINIRHLDDAAQPIPLPDINYHKLEQFLMLCEMADGSSRHYNKLPKRVQRLKEACETQITNNESMAKVKAPLFHMAGVTDANQLQTNLAAVNTIDGYLSVHDATNFNAGLYTRDAWMIFIRSLMIHVCYRVTNNAQNLNNNTWQDAEKNRQKGNSGHNAARTVWAGIWNKYQTQNNENPLRVSSQSQSSIPGIQRYRSDDLALLDQLQVAAATSHDLTSGTLIDTSKLFPSTVSHWRILRVDDRDVMLKVFAEFKTQFNLLKAKDNTLSFHHKFYTREDDRGHIPECLVIAKKGEEIISVCTLVVGLDSRSGYSRMSSVDLDIGKNTIAVLADIARQRKLTAAMIHDYPLKTTIAAHYNVIKNLMKLT